MGSGWFETVAEAQRRARRRLPPSVYGALIAGSEKGVTGRDNLAAFEELAFAPHVVGHSPKRDLTTTVLGVPLALPVVISPVGVQAVHPDGEVTIALGSSDPRPRWPWTLPVDNAVATARILPLLADRAVVLLSSVEVYGSAPAPLRESTPPELPWTLEQIDEWCDEAIALAAAPCPPWPCCSLTVSSVDFTAPPGPATT